jgi:Xaa-Pro aminopeptidase
MLTHEGLKRDVAKRIERIQAMMREKDLDALIIVGQAAPGSLGALRYITNAHLWGGAAYAVLGINDPHPWLEVWSSYQAVWSRNETTTLPERVESPDDDIVGRVTGLAKEYATGSKRIGMVNMTKVMPVGTHKSFVKALEGYEMVEVTEPFNAIRQIKTPLNWKPSSRTASFWIHRWTYLRKTRRSARVTGTYAPPWRATSSRSARSGGAPSCRST